MVKLLDEIEKRTGLVSITHEEVFDKLAPESVHWWDKWGLSCFGGLSLVFFTIQVISGIFLLIHYIPHPDHAFASVQFIDSQVTFGWFVRRIHAIGSNIMIILVLIHMMKVFYTQAYKSPREFHWISGVFLLLLTLGELFSGYVLPWTQMSFWAATVVTNSMGVVPVIGDWVIEFIRGGANIAGPTLGRFFMMHLSLPVVMAGFLGLHFIMIRKTGIAEPL